MSRYRLSRRVLFFSSACITIVATRAGAIERTAPPRFEDLKAWPVTSSWAPWQRRISMVQENARLIDCLSRLESASEASIWLDRRVDPNLRIQLNASNEPLSKIVQVIAKQVGAKQVGANNVRADDVGIGVSVIPPVVYLGPSQTADQLATRLQAQRLRLFGISRRRRQVWVRRKAMSWPTATEPRRLVAALIPDFQGSAADLGLIPHDVWAAKKLPAVDPLLALTLVLAGFDLTPKLEPSGTVAIVSIPSDVPPITLRHTLRPSPTASQLSDFRMRLEDIDPLARLRRHGATGEFHLTGRWETHLAFRQLGNANDNRAGNDAVQKLPVLSRQRLSLAVKQQPLERIVDSLCRQLVLSVDWGTTVSSVRQQRIDVNVEQATVRQLLDAVFGAVPVGYELRKRELTITQE